MVHQCPHVGRWVWGVLSIFLPFWINGAGEDETEWLARLAGCYRIAGWVCAILVGWVDADFLHRTKECQNMSE